MKKLSEQLRAHNKTESSSGPLGLGSDLSQILSSFLERSGTGHGKGSRFQHAEKLQFAKVMKIFAIRILSIHSCPLVYLLSPLFLFLPTFVFPFLSLVPRKRMLQLQLKQHQRRTCSDRERKS